MQRPLIALSLATLPLLGGCDRFITGCAGVGRPAFEVSVEDAQTQAPIAAGATVYVFRRPELARIDSVTGRADTERIETRDTKGRFDVVVEKPGYFPWTRENINVGGDCTTETVALTARLRRRDAAANAPAA